MRPNRPVWALTSIILLICLTGCVKSWQDDYDDVGFAGNVDEAGFVIPESIDPEEMYQWEPPSERELEARRLRQREMDLLTAEIEKLVFGFNELELAARNLDGGRAAWDQKLAELDRSMLARIAELEKLNKASGEKVANLKGSIGKLENELQAIIRARDSKKFKEGQYRTAYILFRDKKYRGAAAQFLRVLKSRYPAHLRDNILFGVGASFYKLRKWKQASQPLKTLVKEVPKGDKWQEASLLLALTHYRNKQRSRALFILENAMKRNPPPRIRHLMKRLEQRIQEDPTVVTN
ncbi:MAG: hypothetical protein G3M70_16140 [Candidatus Nitronauta litoralis]|uniref:Tetratricopeptide repeat protein n=1 Tax=Candidatus Nitronauta litoralis TaxID=2705533 RepID=A0A7T0BZD7_9BACT|nr:MAG: hypothetical protein G3M70_16140 [Candidatus Nitronauta litoralis]